MKQITVARFAATLVLAAVTTAASAEDFVFNVPLRYANLDARLGYVEITCSIYGRSLSDFMVSGTERANFDSSGNYSGTLRIAMNMPPGSRRAAEAREYVCRPRFFSPTGGNPGGGTDPSVYAKALSAPFVNEVSGYVGR